MTRRCWSVGEERQRMANVEGQMSEAHDAVVQKILGAIDKAVRFRHPSAEPHKHGKLKDRAVASSVSNAPGVPYWDVVDLIEFEDEPESLWIRIGYCRKPADRLN